MATMHGREVCVNQETFFNSRHNSFSNNYYAKDPAYTKADRALDEVSVIVN